MGEKLINISSEESLENINQKRYRSKMSGLQDDSLPGSSQLPSSDTGSNHKLDSYDLDNLRRMLDAEDVNEESYEISEEESETMEDIKDRISKHIQ